MTVLTSQQQELVESHHNMIYWFMRKVRIDIEEYYDVFALALCKAAIHFNPNINVAFSTYLSKTFYNEYFNLTNKLLKENKEYEFLEDVHVIDGENDIVNEIDARMQLQNINKHLNEREMKILYHYAKGYSCREIAKKMHCSKNAVTKITQKVQLIFS